MFERNIRFKKVLDHLYSTGQVADQQELSKRTGIHESTISRILNNKVRQPSPDTIKKLVDKFPEINASFVRCEDDELSINSNSAAAQNVDSSSLLNAIIASHNVALAAKDEAIKCLKREIAQKDELIAFLHKRIAELEHSSASIGLVADESCQTFPHKK